MADKRLRHTRIDRRQLLAGAAGLAGLHWSGLAQAAAPLMRTIPATGQKLPAIGMGSWLTFDVGRDMVARKQRTKVLEAFFAAGGGMIDSSPMYGTSEEIIGYGLKQLGMPQTLFSATKVWTLTQTLGVRQMNASQKLWGLDRFDLMQIHNMLDWETHLETLKAWKAEGRIRHIGITTSHGRRHGALEQVMKSEPLDFVQFTYNILDREAEKRLLPLARDRGQAVIINRPFQRGGLFRRVRRKPLPAFADELGISTWAQFFLKFIIAYPAVTCAIPATTRVDHMRENMVAATGPMPDVAMRKRMIEHVETL